jgi:ADP-ribosylglycohydrolase
MVSDDTEHACITAQSLIASGGDVDRFRRELARRLRWWLLGLPAGAGLATLRATLRLWAGVSPERSGVFSAGNGPAMRSAILGAAVDDLERLRQLVRASTRMTHTDPKAERGAFAVALAAKMARERGGVACEDYLTTLEAALSGEDDDFIELVRRAVESVQQRQSTVGFADALGLSQRVTGYIYHSVPVALHAWMSHPCDFRSAVAEVIACGGDTDSTGAIVGGIVGAAVGKDGISQEWLNGLWEWPRSVAWVERLGEQLAETLNRGSQDTPLSLPAYGLLPRNVVFLLIVLFHGFRRLLPPY